MSDELLKKQLLALEGDDIAISPNAQYLMDVLKANGDGEVVISLSDPLKPVLMKPVGNDDYICVIVLMRL